MASMDREQKERHGLRIVFMILFWLILRLSYFITVLLAFVQWVWLWFGKPDSRLRLFSVSHARFQRQVVDYLLFNTHHKPFPFDDWPSSVAEDFQPEDETPLTSEEDAQETDVNGEKR